MLLLLSKDPSVELLFYSNPILNERMNVFKWKCWYHHRCLYIYYRVMFVFVYFHCVVVWCVYLMSPHSLDMTCFFLRFSIFTVYIFIALLSVCKIIRILFSALSKSFPIQICTWWYIFFLSFSMSFVVVVILCMFVFPLSIEYDKRKYELVGWYAKQKEVFVAKFRDGNFLFPFCYKRT